MKQVVRDKSGNSIYLTDERWQHILTRHAVLRNFEQEILKTIRTGKRTQDDLYPDKFFYNKAFKNLPYGYTHIEVVVLSRVQQGKSNNFVVTAYPITRG